MIKQKSWAGDKEVVERLNIKINLRNKLKLIVIYI